MNAEAFIDSNILLYAITGTDTERAKAECARDLLKKEHWAWSVQVAREFFVRATSTNFSTTISQAEARVFIETWLDYPIVSDTPGLLLEALDLREKFMLSYWDSNIIAAARSIGCRILYTEDLSHGQDYSGVEAINPFIGADQ